MFRFIVIFTTFDVLNSAQEHTQSLVNFYQTNFIVLRFENFKVSKYFLI